MLAPAPETVVTPNDDDRREAEEASLRLRVYFDRVWPIVEPGKTLKTSWYLDAIAEHLEAVFYGQIRHLLITMPPRFLKTTTATIIFPTWVWTRWAGTRFLTGSYDMGLSTEHAVLSRRIIESFWYQQHYGDKVQLTTDQNVKTHYENTARGYRMATSTGGASTGHGGDILISDDLLNVKLRHSEAARKTAIDWRLKVWTSRVNDPKTGAFIDVMQRVNTKDVGAAILDQGQVEHLCLPQEYDPKRSIVTSIGFKDPRTEPGALLCPERFGPEENAKAKKALGTDYNAQHNQNPTAESGNLFKRADFKVLSSAEAEARLKDAIFCRGWDCAATEDDGDYTAGVKMARTPTNDYIVVHVVRGQWGPTAADDVMLSTVRADGPACRQREEQEPGSAGKKLIAAHLKLFTGHDFKGELSTGDKVTRARPHRAQHGGGNVYLVQAPWNQEYIDELCDFPKGDNDDQVDASSTAFNELALGQGETYTVPVTGA